MTQSTQREPLHERLSLVSGPVAANRDNNAADQTEPLSCRRAARRSTTNSIHLQNMTTSVRANTLNRLALLLGLCLAVALLAAGSSQQADASDSVAGRVSQVAHKLQSSGARLVRKLDLSKSSGQINEWLVHQVAPAMATKIIDNVLQAPKSGGSKKAKASESGKTIDTQALADKIVDKLAESIKKRKTSSSASAGEPETERGEQTGSSEDSAAAADDKKAGRGANRRGKSLVSDSVQHVVQLFSRDQRKFFGRAMEKSKLPLRANLLHQNNSWLMVKEPAYDSHLFVSTDSSQLDDNPVVLRAEHGHNASTISPINHETGARPGNQNLSPLISSLMSSSTTNQLGNKLLQKQRMQQKYVHTNRHQQQHLSPKPWPAPNNRRHPQPQSPYSLPVTSDMNIVSAPSSPAPLPVSSFAPTTTTSATTTSTSTTTPNPLPTFSYVPPPQPSVTQLGPNKFKINNRHQGSQPSMSLSSQSWYSSNRQHQHSNQHGGYQGGSNNHRFQHHHPSTTSTTSTTTTTTTTTPEPPMTEPTLTDTMESLLDLDQQTSSPVTSILSSVAQSALESLSSGSSNSLDSDYSSYSTNSSSYGGLSSSSSPSPSSSPSSSSSSSGVKGASPSTTSARHSVISAEAIPTALGAPLYHLTRANFTATSIMAPPPRRSSSSPAAKAAAQYFQKGLNNLSSTIFGRQSKSWARRLGISSMLLSGLLYGAAIFANPGAPLPTNGFEVLQALTKNKRRRGSRENLLPPVGESGSGKLATPVLGPLNPALLDNTNVNILYQQAQLIPIIEHLVQQEQLQQQQRQQQNSVFSQRSFSGSPIEIESFADSNRVSRRASPSQYYEIQALPKGATVYGYDNSNDMFGFEERRRTDELNKLRQKNREDFS